MTTLAQRLAAARSKHKIAATPATTVKSGDATPAKQNPFAAKKGTVGGLAALRAAAEERDQKAKDAQALSGLDALVSTVKHQKTRLESHIESQTAKGVYSLSDEAANVEGLDGATLIANLQALDAATIEKTPDIATFSRAIRKNLEQYPELTHILTDDQIGILVGGYLEMAGVKTAPKSAAAKSAAAKKTITSLNDVAEADLDSMFNF